MSADTSEQREVFLLGAGFSRAISPEMPLTKDLGKEISQYTKIYEKVPTTVRQLLQTDFERALTFLAHDKPWLPESENLRQRACYLELVRVLRRILHEKCRSPLTFSTNSPPRWLEALVNYWHRNRSVVITLNYDTLIERVAGEQSNGRAVAIPTGLLYPIPLVPARLRTSAGVPEEVTEGLESFRLLKLHGSINWLYSGRSQFYGEELFYVPCLGGVDGMFDTWLGEDREAGHWANVYDKTSLIIPPVLDKNFFFQHESLQSMWSQASRAIRQATKLICMGYSLPSSDLTMAEFLRTSAPEKPVSFEIVNREASTPHFESVLKADQFIIRQNTVADEDCIPRFVLGNCCVDDDERRAIITFTNWRKQNTSE
jgi:hypothetical protein